MAQARDGQASLSFGRATLLIAGDWAPIRAFGPIFRSEPEALYGDALPLLRQADLRIVNCECALTSVEAPVWKSGAVFKGEPGAVRGLTAVPFDFACLANNHVLDHGVAGLRETLQVLEAKGIQTVGAGLTEEEAWRPGTWESGDLRVHVINFSEGEDLTAAQGGPGVAGWEVLRVLDRIRECKAQGGLVLVIGHCGLEYVPFPPPYVVAAFRAMVDAGADAVIGHHPHVPQGIEWRKGRPIVYSLGNFVFYQPTELLHRKTGFFVTLAVDGERITDLELHPYRITDQGVRLLGPDEERAFRQVMRELSAPFGTPTGHREAWNAYLDFYGAQGFRDEVLGILERLKTEPNKAAAMFRNRLTTMQHAELWKDLLTSTMTGGTLTYPARARELVEAWFTEKSS